MKQQVKEKMSKTHELYTEKQFRKTSTAKPPLTHETILTFPLRMPGAA